MARTTSDQMRDFVNWDVDTWSRAIELWDAAVRDAPPVLRCLEVGAGPGGPSLWLALKGHEVVTTNWEYTREQAAPLHERYGIHPEYRDVDLTARIPWRDEFDIVVFKSVLGGLGADFARQKHAMAEILAALKPGGRLLFAENLRATWLHRLGRAVAYRVRRASLRFTSYAEMRELLGRFEDVTLRTTGVLAVFGASEPQRNALTRVDDAVANRLVPASWRYVAYRMARKPLTREHG